MHHPGSLGAASRHSRGTTLPFSTVRARRPCFSSSALSAEKLAPPAGQRRDLGMSSAAMASRSSTVAIILAATPWLLATLAQQHLEQFDRRAAAAVAPLALDASAGSWGRARARARSRPEFRRRRATAPSRAGMERRCRKASALRGAASAMLDQASSFRTRERGTSRVCASRSRQAATSMSTARSRGLRRRLRSRSQAFSGCCS